MVARLNYIFLVMSVLLTTYFYLKSVRPATLSQKMGPRAYQASTVYRIISVIFMVFTGLHYVLYSLYPLRISIPRTFPWNPSIAVLMGIVLSLPAFLIWWRGVKDAGDETLVVREAHTLNSGIYQRIRHPQALGTVLFWWVLSFLLNSPFLLLFSLIWVPIFIMLCWAEEQDLPLRYGEAYLEYRKRTGAVFPKKA